VVGVSRDALGSYDVPLTILSGLALLCAVLFFKLPAYRYVAGKVDS
jgi:cyanate permease